VPGTRVEQSSETVLSYVTDSLHTFYAVSCAYPAGSLMLTNKRDRIWGKDRW